MKINLYVLYSSEQQVKKDFHFLMIHNVLLWLQTIHSEDEEYQKRLLALNECVLQRLEVEECGDITDYYVLCEVEECSAPASKTKNKID